MTTNEETVIEVSGLVFIKSADVLEIFRNFTNIYSDNIDITFFTTTIRDAVTWNKNKNKRNIHSSSVMMH